MSEEKCCCSEKHKERNEKEYKDLMNSIMERFQDGNTMLTESHRRKVRGLIACMMVTRYCGCILVAQMMRYHKKYLTKFDFYAKIFMLSGIFA